MATIQVKCGVCGGTIISKNGKGANGVQRYLCNDKEYPGKSFMLEYAYNGWKPGIAKDIVNMTANVSGIRDIAKVLEISNQNVSDILKNKKRNK